MRVGGGELWADALEVLGVLLKCALNSWIRCMILTFGHWKLLGKHGPIFNVTV